MLRDVCKKKKREPLSKLKCPFPHSISDFFPILPWPFVFFYVLGFFSIWRAAGKSVFPFNLMLFSWHTWLCPGAVCWKSLEGLYFHIWGLQFSLWVTKMRVTWYSASLKSFFKKQKKWLKLILYTTNHTSDQYFPNLPLRDFHHVLFI